MKHTIKTEYTNEDGELIPAVIVEAPDLIWLQVANYDEDEAAPPDERTFHDERVMESDVAYMPLARAEGDRVAAREHISYWQARAERAEVERDALRAQLAAQEWRPVRDMQESGDIEMIVRGKLWDFFFYNQEGGVIYNEDVVAWRPAPPQ